MLAIAEETLRRKVEISLRVEMLLRESKRIDRLEQPILVLLLDRFRRNAVEALVLLSNATPTDAAGIMATQNEILIFTRFCEELEQMVSDGREADAELETLEPVIDDILSGEDEPEPTETMTDAD